MRVSNCLDPDQDRHFVGPDLSPNCLQTLGYQQIIKVAASKKRVYNTFPGVGRNDTKRQFDQEILGHFPNNFFVKYEFLELILTLHAG